MLATDQAMAASGFEEALGHIDAALSMEEAPEGEGRADLLFKRGQVFRSLGRPAGARDAWNEALPIYEGLGATEQVARLCLDTAYAWTLEGDYQKAVDVCHRGLAAVGEGESPERCRLEAATGFSLGNIGEHDDANTRLEQARTMAESLGDRRLLGEVLRYDARFRLYHGEISRMTDAGLRSVEALRAAGAMWDVADVSALLQAARMMSLHPQEALELDNKVRPLAERLGHHGALFVADMSRGLSQVVLDGRLETHEESTKRGISRWQQAGEIGPWMGSLMFGTSLFYQGRWDEAVESFHTATSFAFAPFAGIAWGARFLVEAYDGRPGARGIWDEHRARVPEKGAGGFLGAWMFARASVEALAMLGDRNEAHALHPLIVEALAQGMRVGLMGELTRTGAGIAAACGETWATAQEHFETALKEADETPHKIAQPDARRWYAWMLIDRDASGDRDKARMLLSEAVEMYQAVGMPKHLELAEGMLGKL